MMTTEADPCTYCVKYLLSGLATKTSTPVWYTFGVWRKISIMAADTRDILAWRRRDAHKAPPLLRYRSAEWFIMTTICLAVFTVGLSCVSGTSEMYPLTSGT